VNKLVQLDLTEYRCKSLNVCNVRKPTTVFPFIPVSLLMCMIIGLLADPHNACTSCVHYAIAGNNFKFTDDVHYCEQEHFQLLCDINDYWIHVDID